MADLYDDMDTVSQANGGSVFPDPLTTLKVRQDQIARRRALAQQLTAQAMQNDGQMVSGHYVAKSPWLSFAQGLTGSMMNSGADKDATELELQQRMAQGDWSKRYQSAPDDTARQGLLTEARDRGLRYDLEQQFAKAEADRIGKREDKAIEMSSKAEIARETAATRAQEREDQRKWQEEQNKLYRRTAEQQGQRQGAANADLDRQIKETRLEQMRNPPAKPLPAARQKAVDDSDALIGHIDNAIGLLQANPDAMGAKTIIPDVALQRIDPEGVATRAAVGGLSAAKIHELSGAAVSPAEFARLRPYLPASGDSSETVQKKLAGLRKEAQRIRATHAAAPDTQSTRLKFNPATGRLE